MTSRLVRHLLGIPFILALPVVAWAQEASIGGTVRDATGGVLPGVTVTAVHEATGNSFETVTDERGGFRVAVRTGTYRVVLELPGFATLTRTGLEVLVGQQIVVSFEMAPSGLQETLTVTAEAPLVDRASSQLGGNVDPRQLSELPVNGRNWLDLTSLTPGSRTNATAEAPVGGEARGTYQLNLDGQQVTNYVQYNRANPRYSRDAIAEFEFIANRFDATQGRSMGVQVNAVTKSGTNTPAGTVAGYFRNDRFNAADHVVGRRLEVLESADQRHVRRTDPARSRPLLRQLRVRAGTSDLHVDDAVSAIQSGSGGHALGTESRYSPRHAVLSAVPPVVSSQ